MKKQKFSHEKLSQNYFDIAEVILVVLDEAGVIESINRKGCAVLGVSADEIVGKNWFDLCIPKENLQAVKSAFAQLISGDLEPVAYYENPVVTSEGSLRLIAWHNSYLTDDQGRIVGILSSGEDITEKKFFEELLKKSEERFRYLADNSTDFIWEIDEHSIFTYVSPSVDKVLGYRPDEVVGRSVFDLMPENERQTVAEKFFPLIEKRMTFAGLENINLHKDGRLVTIESSGVPTFNNDGLFVGYRGINRNITLRKQAEKEKEQQMEVLKLASRVGSALAKLSRLDEMLHECCELVVSHNKAAFCRIWLIPENSQVLELAASAGLYTQLDGSFSRKTVDNASKIGTIALTNQPYIANDLLGDPLVVEKNWVKTEKLQSFAGYPLFVNNRVIGVIALFSQNVLSESVLTSFMAITDEIAITVEKKRVEERLLHVASALGNVAEEVIITDFDGKIFYVNPACEKITGYNRTELIGSNPRIFQSGKHDQAFYEDLWNTITSGDTWTNRIINKTKAGRLILEDATISSVIDPTGKHLGYVSVKRDVTEQVRLEENLQQSQKMEAIGTLAGGIAHDFNNLLNAILGYSELLLLDLPEEGNQYRRVDRIRSAGLQAAELVQQILAFSRRTEKQRLPLRLQLVVKEALKLLRSSLPTTIEIQQDIDPNCSLVRADNTNVHQVFMNLCTNAYHAMKASGGILYITLKEIAVIQEDIPPDVLVEAGSYVVMIVRDSGYGMDSVTRERIFEPYFTTKGQGEGTGLGLATVHGIVKDHGGWITVTSDPGQGSIFSVYWPVFIGEIVVKSEKEKAPPKQMPFRGNAMFVDDAEFNVLLGGEILQQMGCTVSGFTDSHEALAVFKKNPNQFDVVITDQTMPGLTGFELAVKMLDIRPDLPIIMITGHSDIVDEEKAKAVGIRDFLLKPIRIESLSKALAKIDSLVTLGT